MLIDREITEREKELYNYILNFTKVNGFPPTIREMAEGINTKSLAHIYTMLDHLEFGGFITIRGHKTRTIVCKKFDIQ